MNNQADIPIATPPSTDQDKSINLIGPIVNIDGVQYVIPELWSRQKKGSHAEMS
jgi:hypothetical protein